MLCHGGVRLLTLPCLPGGRALESPPALRWLFQAAILMTAAHSNTRDQEAVMRWTLTIKEQAFGVHTDVNKYSLNDFSTSQRGIREP